MVDKIMHKDGVRTYHCLSLGESAEFPWKDDENKYSVKHDRRNARRTQDGQRDVDLCLISETCLWFEYKKCYVNGGGALTNQNEP